MNLKEAHLNFISDLFFMPCEFVLFQGHKYLTNITVEFEGDVFSQGADPGYDCADLGYARNETKMSQLMSHYYNEDSINAARAKIRDRKGKARDFTSVAVSCVGGKKKDSTQGHCIQSVIFRYHKDNGWSATVMYRITECCQKFAADLLFLKDILFPAVIGDNPLSEVTFMFANIYLSPMYYTAILDGSCARMMLHDITVASAKEEYIPQRVFSAIVRCLKVPYLNKNCDHYGYASRRRMHTLLVNKMEADPEFTEQVKIFLMKAGAINE